MDSKIFLTIFIIVSVLCVITGIVAYRMGKKKAGNTTNDCSKCNSPTDCSKCNLSTDCSKCGDNTVTCSSALNSCTCNNVCACIVQGTLVFPVTINKWLKNDYSLNVTITPVINGSTTTYFLCFPNDTEGIISSDTIVSAGQINTGPISGDNIHRFLVNNNLFFNENINVLYNQGSNPAKKIIVDLGMNSDSDNYNITLTSNSNGGENLAPGPSTKNGLYACALELLKTSS